MKKTLSKIKQTLEMIQFSHSIFALPFALATLFFATNGKPQIKELGLIIICMVLARNVAMAFNRLVDAKLDAKNPRTSNRHLPQKILTKNFVIAFIIINILLFILASSLFNELTFYLSPLALIIICFYSLTKRFTNFTQLFLGIALGISPLATWIAIKGELGLFPTLISLGVFFWVAGFDLIYATQDYDHDKKHQIKSMVAKFGIRKSLSISKLFHFISIVCFYTLGIIFDLSIVYFITISIMGIFLFYEQSLVKPDDLSRLNKAFFTINSFVGIIFLIGSFLEIIL
jgi:4-hydroxybenzoate polyprenyltransferase